MPIPFARTISGRGEGFACKACGRTLIVPKLGVLKAVLIGGAGLLVAKVFGVAGFIIALAVIGLGDWKFARTRLADQSGEA